MSKRHITKFTEDSKKKLRKIPQKQSMQILDKLTELQQAMDKGDLGNLDVKRIEGRKQKEWRLKIGDHYRLAFTLEELADGTLITWIWVIDVGPRENFYS